MAEPAATPQIQELDAIRSAGRAILALVEPVPAISPPPPPTWAETMTSGIGSPGRGRRTRIPSAFETQATRALKAELGEPTVRTQRGSTLQIWEADSEGDGIVCARLSSEDLDKVSAPAEYWTTYAG
jgi:hypothetical protein